MKLAHRTRRRLAPLLAALALAGCGGGSVHDSIGKLSLPAGTVHAVTLATSLSGQFVSAENGGGGAVDANRAVASTWEAFQLVDRNGGDLQSGDLVSFATSDGMFLSAEHGGGSGSTIDALRAVASTWETFRILKRTGGDGVVRMGDSIALQTSVSGSYVSALDGGGAGLVADRTAIQSWETFVLGAASGSSSGGALCSGAELAQCNCPSGFHCCPTDGSCFQNAGDIIYTQCKDDAAATCLMSGGASAPAPAPTPAPAPAPSPSPSPSPPSSLPTRLRITSQCAQPIWIAHSDNVTDPQNVQLAKGQSYDYQIPAGGLPAARFWPKTGCDGGGHGCAIGDNGQGGGVPCPANGCQPPVDSKFEVSFAAAGASAQTWYNLSQVDGYTLPFKVSPTGSGANQGSCVASDCSQLSLDRCPAGDNLSEGGAHPAYASEDLRVRDGSSNVIGCMAPCKKLNYPAPWGVGLPESSDPALHMCCPTPIDPASGNCTVANGCMTSQACSNAGDPASVVHTGYVAAIRAMCPSAYSYAYDDAAGLHACSSDTGFQVTFCP